MDSLIQLKEKRESYTRELENKEVVLNVKREELKKSQSRSAALEIEKDKLSSEEHVFAKDMQVIEELIVKWTSYIKNTEQANASIKEELVDVPAFSFGKKKEIKAQIELNEKKVSEAHRKLTKLSTQKLELEKTRKIGALNTIEIQLKHLQENISVANEEIIDLETSISKLKAVVLSVENEMERQDKLITGQINAQDNLKSQKTEVEWTVLTKNVVEEKAKIEAEKNSCCLELEEAAQNDAAVITTEKIISQDIKLLYDIPEERDSLIFDSSETSPYKMKYNKIAQETPVPSEDYTSLTDEKMPVVLYYRTLDIDASGYEKSEIGFVVKKGSRISDKEKITCSEFTKKLRREYANYINQNNVLENDIVFKSVNDASNFCIFGATIASLAWVTEDGTTLRDLRKVIDPIADARLVEQARKAEEDDAELEKPETAYYQIYGLNPESYTEIDVETLAFSFRLEKRLIRNGYSTVEALLKANDDTLKEISGLGKGCFDELHSYFKTLSTNPISVMYSNEKCGKLTVELAPYKEQLLWGDFSFLNDKVFSEESIAYIQRFKDAHAILDFELVEEVVNETPASLQLFQMLMDFTTQIDQRKKYESIISEIPENRVKANASWLISCYTNDENLRGYLKSLNSAETNSLGEYILLNTNLVNSNDPKLLRFIKWCRFNLKTDVDHFFVDLIKNERQLQVVKERAEGKTLESISKPFDITRERVRQIEMKAVRTFKHWQKHNRIMFKVFIEMNEKAGLSAMELIDFIGIYGQEFVYLMKSCDDDEIIYDKQLDMFIIDDLSLTEKIQAYVDALPDAFPEKKLAEYLQSAEEEYEYPVKMVEAFIEENYKKTGDTYHRFRLSLASIYSDVLARYYPEGMHVYDDTEIGNFQKLIYSEYGIDISNKSYRAVGSIISRIGFLCGRGIYKPHQQKPYIPKELAMKIHHYIEESQSPIFMTNTLFSIFEEELLAVGVDNKYFLHGILRDLYGSEWIFRRDYISKDESYTSVYSSIVGFIKKSEYPVAKDDIQREFPGVTEVVINLSISDPNIINLFGQYIHSSHLKLTNTDIKYFKGALEKHLTGKDVCHCKEIYEDINNDYPVLLRNNFVNYAFSLYSLLEYLFRDNYIFSRPFVARENANIERVGDVIRDMVKESETISISDIMAFAREQHYTVYNILGFADSFNETHLLLNNMDMASIEYIGVNEDIAYDLERLIAAEIDGTVPIHQLQSIHSLPKINVQWSTWLIYSILKKWAISLEVGTSNNQFRQGYPLVAPIGKFNASKSIIKGVEYDGKLGIADDLSKIDELIGDYILDELEGFHEL